MATREISNSQKTCWQSYADALQKIGRDFYGAILNNSQSIENATLNNILGINIGPSNRALIPPGTLPEMRYMVIGTGGMLVNTSTDNLSGGSTSSPGVTRHAGWDANLFNLHPLHIVFEGEAEFVGGATGSQVSAHGYYLRERKQLLTVEDGVTVMKNADVYYAAEIDPEKNIEPEIRLMTVGGGNVTGNTVVDLNDPMFSTALQPIPLEVDEEPVIINTSFILTSVVVRFTLGARFIHNLRRAFVRNGTHADDPTIREIGICHGIKYVEALDERLAACQIVTHIAKEIPLAVVPPADSDSHTEISVAYYLTETIALPQSTTLTIDQIPDFDEGIPAYHQMTFNGGLS